MSHAQARVTSGVDSLIPRSALSLERRRIKNVRLTGFVASSNDAWRTEKGLFTVDADGIDPASRDPRTGHAGSVHW
jgi:hypothetical protein